MQTRRLGNLWPVSRLTLGGGGLGQVWGRTDRDEAVATVHAAVDGGITLFDLAPLYGRGEAEAVIGAAFDGRPPSGVRFTTKCQLGTPATPSESAATSADISNAASTAMRLIARRPAAAAFEHHPRRVSLPARRRRAGSIRHAGVDLPRSGHSRRSKR